MSQPREPRSLWEATAPAEPLPPLESDLVADVCVVGAGIAGLSVAHRVAREGGKVVVLDRLGVAAGNTGVTTAHLASVIDDRFEEIERLHGRDGSRLAYESHQAAIESIASNVAEEGIDCDLVRLDAYLFLGASQSVDELERELAAARRAGFADAELLASAPDAPFEMGPCLRFPRQGRFHPLRYVKGLASAVQRRGGQLLRAAVVEVEGGKGTHVRTEDGRKVSAGAIVVATGTPIHERVMVHAKQEPWLTYVVAARLRSEVPDWLLWDTDDPYHYIRLQRAGGDCYLIVGGEDHKSGEEVDPSHRWDCLETWTRERFPVASFEHRWAGMVFEPIDAMGFIGRSPGYPGNVYLATGDSGQGMTHGAIAGLLIPDLVAGRENPWETLYDPSRKTLRAGVDFAKAGASMAGHYAEWVTGAEGQVESAEQIAAGSGAILRRRGAPIAAYRDKAGTLHERSAVCTHLGCIVHWNAAQELWDCPCHGSRFGPTGDVVQGPAKQPLARVEE